MSCRDQLLGGQHVVVADGLAELAHDLVIGHGFGAASAGRLCPTASG
jgi:hypothetical protein